MRSICFHILPTVRENPLQNWDKRCNGSHPLTSGQWVVVVTGPWAAAAAVVKVFAIQRIVGEICSMKRHKKPLKWSGLDERACEAKAKRHVLHRKCSWGCCGKLWLPVWEEALLSLSISTLQRSVYAGGQRQRQPLSTVAVTSHCYYVQMQLNAVKEKEIKKLTQICRRDRC